MQIELELLAPAKNRDIGIAAIDCGADAVYIAGPSFGAREAAGNSMSEVAELVRYAGRFGVKIYMTLNTILYDNELESARELVYRAYDAGCSAIIVQDLSLLKMELPPIKLFASTQTNIRTPQQAVALKNLGFERLILARELSLRQIAEIKEAAGIDIETFVHGALCVSYSGQCYLSEYLTGRSANRGACAQACRSAYTLVDGDGNLLVKNEPLLSLKDLNLSRRVPDLVKAGVTSFKIEGRLKNDSYIKNVVREYSIALDRFIEGNPEYVRASYGRVSGGFVPNPGVTFNRGFTTLNIDGKRGKWKSEGAAKYIGEPIATVVKSGRGDNGVLWFDYKPINGEGCPIVNGDGLCFLPKGSSGVISEIVGARANSCNGRRVSITEKIQIPIGATIYRNYNFLFEKELEKNMPERQIAVHLSIKEGLIVAETVGGKKVSAVLPLGDSYQPARNEELARKNLYAQLSKKWPPFSFELVSLEWPQSSGPLPFIPTSQINAIRRDLASLLEQQIRKELLQERTPASSAKSGAVAAQEGRGLDKRLFSGELSYLANCSNSLSKALYIENGAERVEPAYELNHKEGVELMRTKYCIKYELGLCPKSEEYARGGAGRVAGRVAEPLYLLNGKHKLRLKFDCSKCEMVVIG